MKRKHFITFGSVLAIVLTLATVGYLVWFVTTHARSRTVLSDPLAYRQAANDVEFKDGNFLIFRLWITRPCDRCSKNHSIYKTCNSDWARMQDTPRHLFDFRLPLTGAVSAVTWIGTSFGRMRAYHLALNEFTPILLLAAYPVIYFLILGVRRFRRRSGHCLHCDYDLTGNESGVCPECGTAILEVARGHEVRTE